MSALSEARTLQFTRLLLRTWRVPSWQWLHIHTWYYHCFRHVRSRINQFFLPHSYMCNIMFLHRLRFKFWLHRLQNWAYFVSFLPFQTYNSSVIQGILSACPWGGGGRSCTLWFSGDSALLWSKVRRQACKACIQLMELQTRHRHNYHISSCFLFFFFLRWVKT